MAAKAELTRGVITLQQTEQWHILTDQPMRALRKPLVNFEGCTTASQCIGSIDVPNPADCWQVTMGAKKNMGQEVIELDDSEQVVEKDEFDDLFDDLDDFEIESDEFDDLLDEF